MCSVQPQLTVNTNIDREQVVNHDYLLIRVPDGCLLKLLILPSRKQVAYTDTLFHGRVRHRFGSYYVSTPPLASRLSLWLRQKDQLAGALEVRG